MRSPVRRALTAVARATIAVIAVVSLVAQPAYAAPGDFIGKLPVTTICDSGPVYNCTSQGKPYLCGGVGISCVELHP